MWAHFPNSHGCQIVQDLTPLLSVKISIKKYYIIIVVVWGLVGQNKRTATCKKVLESWSLGSFEVTALFVRK
jgi:hypothetical protein